MMEPFFAPRKDGWLWKQGGRYKSWKQRWFVLDNNCLYYFKYPTDKEPLGTIPLEDILIREITDEEKPHCLELYTMKEGFIKACKTDRQGKLVKGKHKAYKLSATTPQQRDEWMTSIGLNITHSAFCNVLAAKKRLVPPTRQLLQPQTLQPTDEATEL